MFNPHPGPLEPPSLDGRGPAGKSPAPRPLADLLRAASKPRVQAVAAATAYLAFAIYLTWPLALHLNSTLYGAVGDLTGSISTFREIVESHRFPFAPGTLADFNAPEGLPLRWTLNVSTFASFSELYVLTAIFGPLAAVGLYTLSGLTLSGFSMFLLARRLTRHAGAAFVAGFAYAFYPFAIVNAQGHVDFIQGWVLVVAAWRLLELMEWPTRRNGVWAGAALVLAFAWTPYHILFAGGIGLATAAVALVYARRRGLLRPTLAALVVAGAIGATWLGGVALLNRAGPRNEVRSHTIQDAVTYSARAWEYVVPTSEHPIFGEEAGKYRASHVHGSNGAENVLYVGVTVLVLALLGLLTVFRRTGPFRRATLAAGAIAIVGFAFSAPPRVGLLGVNFPTATQFLFDITSTWRVFSRFVLVVMLGLALLAAMGISEILRRRPLVVQAVLIPAILVVIAADLWTARPAHGTNKIVVPAPYQRLAKMPKGIAVEYPLLPAEQSQYGDVFYQGWHDKPILNSYYPGTPEENRALQLTNLAVPRTARGLDALGVRYVLVRRDLKAAHLPDPGRPGRAFRLVSEDPYIALYELRLPRPEVLVSPMEGFAAAEGAPHKTFQWLLEPEGTIELRGTCSPCSGTVSMTLTSLAQPRTVTIKNLDGGKLVSVRVVRSKAVRFPVRFDRKLTLSVTADPGPQSIAAAVGGPDPRSVSVSVARQSFTFGRQASR